MGVFVFNFSKYGKSIFKITEFFFLNFKLEKEKIKFLLTKQKSLAIFPFSLLIKIPFKFECKNL